MRCTPMLACAAAAASIALVAPALADFDSIGTSPASTSGNFWLSSTTNTDAGGDVATCAGIGIISVPAGRAVTEIHAVIGARGPGGGGTLNPATLSDWHVEFWSDTAAFAAAPAAGNLASIAYTAPSNADFATPYGTDLNGRPTYLVKFRLPGGIAVSPSQPTLFAIRASASQSTVGSIGILESTVAGPSGLWASHALAAPGYVAFSSLPFASHGGVFAYRVVAGCPADYNGDGTLSVQDIFDFLGAWFAAQPGANFNGASSISVQDIFDFLSAWFSGC